MKLHTDIVVVGAGHAGIEAALAAARLGQRVTVVTTNLQRIGYMSCNPSIGGLAKGHMVREIDALGGEMGRAADASCIQFKRLNSGKGPAVRGSRVQTDKHVYSSYMTSVFNNNPLIETIEAEVKSLLIEGEICKGVEFADGSQILSQAVIVTTGTFMRGLMFVGLESSPGGRVGDKSSIGLSDQLRTLGFEVNRLKTGTPPRLHRDSIDWSKTTPQFGDEIYTPFSFMSPYYPQLPQVACFLSYTKEKTHEIIRKNLDKSPMFTGSIEGSGPRYCPSIEDKITRFAEKASHQTFLEPEGLNTDLIYLQGISTSLPVDVQYEFLRTIPGLEKVEIVRPGYAVEYDFIEPTQIKHTFETRGVENLFLAGQINGTSGYEEAGAQGLLAGINAVLKIKGQEPFVLERSEAYIGVLIDDLVTKGTKEPYRMFTSRAEHRLILREDNTLDRLFARAENFRLMPLEQLERCREILEKRRSLRQQLDEFVFYPNEKTQTHLRELGTTPLAKPQSASDILRRPEIDMQKILNFLSKEEHRVSESYDEFQVLEPVEVAVKYAGYIDRENEVIAQAKKLELTHIPPDLDYSLIRGLRKEELEKLSHIRPMTIGQAKRISGVNPSAIHSLLIHIKSKLERSVSK